MQRKVLSKFNLWLPPIVWAAVIFLFSSIPLPKTSEIFWKDFIVKKSGHIFVYAVLAILIFRGLRGEGVSKRKAIIWAILLAAFYGVTDEYHQSFVAGREPRVRDLGFDSFGAVAGIYLVNKLTKSGTIKILKS